jgi:hypothetical protein
MEKTRNSSLDSAPTVSTFGKMNERKSENNNNNNNNNKVNDTSTRCETDTSRPGTLTPVFR